MPKKSFFSSRKPVEDAPEPNYSADDNMFDTDFDGMQPLDMFQDENAAADGFAALLNPEDAPADTFDDVMMPLENEGQNVGEAVFQNLFAGDNEDFFAAQPEDAAGAPAEGFDDFFAAQPEDAAGAPAQGFDDFFAAQPEDAPIYTDAAFSGAAFAGDTGAQESTP
ncbi:MAG: hypothetical protein RRZ93_02890, partial [Ruthenibacterium sp.]